MERPLLAPNVFIFEYVLPIFAGREVMKPTVVQGTAFSIGGGCFVTAAHVMRGGKELGWFALGTTDGKSVRAWNITGCELADRLDFAIFRADVDAPVKCFPWYSDELGMSTTVKSVGYPYAMDSERNRMGIRSFVGSVVSATTFGRLPTDPPCYELSFQCPRGLSGAPVYVRDGDLMLVTGMVIGNERQQMTILTDREVVADTKEVIVTERYEALNLGIALQSRAFLDLRSKLLGDRTVREHLAAHGLLRDGRGS